MSEIVLPDFGLVLLFGESTEFAQRWFSAALVDSFDEVVTQLASRRLTAIDANKLAKIDLKYLGRVATDSYARVYVIAIGSNGAELAKRTGSMAVMDWFGLPSAEGAHLRFEPLATDRRGEMGPFDIIGDIHGCADELVELLGLLGYQIALTGAGTERFATVTASPGRRAFFVGDLIDRGPDGPDVMRIVMAMVQAGHALCVAGNHDTAFGRWLEGHKTTLNHGLEATARQFSLESPQFRDSVLTFIDGLKAHLWVDGGRLAIAHAGVKQSMLGRSSGKVRAFALYGDTEPKKSPDGLPSRYHWALDDHGETAVVYGHTPVAEAAWVNNTLCVDTGCCYGGKLTAVRWPEREIVSVQARANYAVLGRALGHPPRRPKRD
ncbi:MAG: metallophosphoesterase [Hyphomicrobiaceae bacterium]